MASGTHYLKLDHSGISHFGSDADVLLSDGAANAMSLSIQAANPYPAVLATPVYRPPIIESPSLGPAAVVMVKPDAVADIPTLAPEPVPTQVPTSAPTSPPSSAGAGAGAGSFGEEASAAPKKKGWTALQIAIMVLAGLLAASLLLLMLFLPRRMGTVIAPTLPGPGSRE